MKVKEVVENIKELPKETEEKIKDFPRMNSEVLKETTKKTQEAIKDATKKIQHDRETRVYAGLDSLPDGFASNRITEGCLVLEGGAFRGVYTSGVLDALMVNDINFRTTIGVSAGAMNGVNYVSGQIGRAARINLKYRNDPRYVGPQAFIKNHGIIGFDFVFFDMDEESPIDFVRFHAPNRKYYAEATNLNTGKPEYFEKSTCSDIFKAIEASASMPFLSAIVEIDGEPYLDGGCSCAIPYQWALDQGFKNIVIVRTRDDSYRNPLDTNYGPMARTRYRNYPKFIDALVESDKRYNDQCNEIESLRDKGRVFVISPSVPLDIGRLEKDTERLSEIYYLGYNDTVAKLNALRKYLKRGDKR